MSARWSELASYLLGLPDQVTLSRRELHNVVGGLPDSARKHPAWSGGDRPQVRACKAAGFQVADKVPGEWVFVRTAVSPSVVRRDAEAAEKSRLRARLTRRVCSLCLGSR